MVDSPCRKCCSDFILHEPGHAPLCIQFEVLHFILHKKDENYKAICSHFSFVHRTLRAFSPWLQRKNKRLLHQSDACILAIHLLGDEKYLSQKEQEYFKQAYSIQLCTPLAPIVKNHRSKEFY